LHAFEFARDIEHLFAEAFEFGLLILLGGAKWIVMLDAAVAARVI
jgi:hypothetical protein